MIKPLIELITNESGDWEVLRVNLGEDFRYAGHSISNNGWIGLLEVLGYEVERKEILDEDIENGDY